MAITRLTKHDNCEVYIQLERWSQSGHYASLQCADCLTHIQWLNKWDVDQIKSLGVKVKQRRPLTLTEFGI